MILVRIFGGLGNQMFQYAAARALALHTRTEVKLDLTPFNEDGLRNFELFRFNIEATVATGAEIDVLKSTNTPQRVRSYLTPYPKKRFYKQPYFHFDPHFFRLSPSVYIKGYFQSERYFAPARAVIRTEFGIPPHLVENVTPLAAAIRAENAVALHVRRGDYKNQEAMRYHGIVPIDYYRHAVDLMLERNRDATFYIFSDDGQWVKENLQLPGATIVSGEKSSTHFEDLYLMTQCRHNIIANSSFSWWGAWLGSDAGKTVIAPRAWFRKGSKDRQDLLPPHWIQL